MKANGACLGRLRRVEGVWFRRAPRRARLRVSGACMSKLAEFFGMNQ